MAIYARGRKEWGLKNTKSDVLFKIPLLTERKGMFKTFKNTAVCVLLAAIMLTGCSCETDTNGNVETGDFNWCYQIRDTPLVYDKDTKIMYYREYRFGMCPYYNEYGQMCYYVDGQVIPIEEVLIDVD